MEMRVTATGDKGATHFSINGIHHHFSLPVTMTLSYRRGWRGH